MQEGVTTIYIAYCMMTPHASRMNPKHKHWKPSSPSNSAD
jgi:hypothetical protein